MRLLVEAYINAINPKENGEKLQARINKKDISALYEEFKKSFDSTKQQVEQGAAVNDFDTHVEAMFHFVRLLRNSIVHPKDMPAITNALVYANIQQFSYYVQTIARLTAYYSKNQISV